MNYWLLTTEYPPSHGGGISTYCDFTVRMFSAQGNAVSVFVPDDAIKDYIISTQEAGVTVIRFNSNRNNLQNTLGYTALLSYSFADIVRTIINKEGPPDLIEAQDYLGIAYYLTQFKHLGYDFIKDIPIVITLHSPAFIYLEYNRTPTYRFPDFWTCEMEKQAIKAADRLISPTHFLVGEIQKQMDISQARIDILANPFKGTPGHNKKGFIANKIVYYGKLSPQKGSFVLLEYFKELWDGGFEHSLHIVGGTDIVFHPEMHTMGQLIRKKYADYITKGLLLFHGKITPAQIYEYLSDAHVILIPSIVDNMPYAVIEAMHLGKIVLASMQGGQREMIDDGITGFLFDHQRPLSFIDQLKKILALPAEMIDRIGENAIRSVENLYSPDTIYSKKYNILQDILTRALQNDNFPFLYQEKPIMAREIATNTHLSVVIPYYNMGTYLEECIGSVLASSHKDLEIIIINDGSTDPGSIDLLNQLSDRSLPVSIIHQPNQGLAFSRNHGASLATGEYLAFLDADDKVSVDYYEKAIRALRSKANVFFVGSWVQYFQNSSEIWPAFTPQPPYALVHNPVNSSSLVYKRAAYTAAGTNDRQVDYGMEDYDSVIGMLESGYNGVVLPEVLFYYRVRTGSMFRKISNEKLLYSNKYIVEKHQAYYAKFAFQIINILNANGPGHLYDNPSFETRVSTVSVKYGPLAAKLRAFVKRNESLKKIFLIIKKLKNKQ